MDITKFNEKFNKLNGNVYTAEEVVKPIDGAYEGKLIHDNVEASTINIYTGSKLTGDKVNTYKISTPSLTPWRTTIQIFSTEPVLYITYETTGDTVEAEDVNNLQDALNETQRALNFEIDRAVKKENQLETDLNTEINRAENKESEIVNDLNTEIFRAKKAEMDEVTRAKASEKTLTDNLNLEISRAKASESTLTDNLNKEIERAQKAEMDEVTRAKSAEKIITDNLTEEVNRASSAEGILTDNLNDEITRAKDSENTLNTNLTNEINRAKSAENTLTTNLATEVTRAINAENSIKNTINTNKPLWDDKYTKAEIDNKINEVITDLDWKESVTTFSDLSTNYPSPQDGWTVNVKDTDITYRWSGSTWVAISANSIPLATSSVDGKMSKEDKTFLDIVRSLWVSVTSHINDTVKHITSTERTNWNDANSKKHTHDNKSVLDGITSTLITAWNSAYSHISDAVKHITSAERTLWNTVSDKLDKSGGTVTGKINILGSAKDNPLNVRGINGIMDNGYGDFESSDLYLNYNTTNKVYVNGTNEVYHKGNLTNLSQLNNDAGYITQADVDTSQNHTHTNKTVLDGITSDKVSSWDNKLSLDGGKVIGKTKFSQGTNVAYMATTTMSGIYKHVAKITVRQNYQNQPITLDIIQRARFGTVIIEFKNANTNDPELRRFTKIGEVEAYLYKSATSTWELYVKMTEQYDCIDIMEFNKGEYMNLVDVTWTTDTLESLPTGYVTAVRQYMDMSVTQSARDSEGNQINTTYVKKGTTWNELEGI
ncbi:hypothetical protein GT646_00785 [Clostridium butyricum]|uniref:hypothetical protein n=1 Tax=Clostridium butyricum TaxID=1492 RepID=UPI00137073E5|nr:hypothetical protein [Clostridium butyricum]MZI79369.1 hypothetical protein [Clostridium butyricum]